MSMKKVKLISVLLELCLWYTDIQQLLNGLFAKNLMLTRLAQETVLPRR